MDKKDTLDDMPRFIILKKCCFAWMAYLIVIKEW